MTLPVLLTALAELDLDEAAQWYNKRSDGLGAEFVASVRETVSRVSGAPELYPQVQPGLRRAPVRRFPYGVFCQLHEDRVIVIAVFHNRRDPSRWQERL